MQHIKDISIKNFKSIRDQKIEDCRRVNVFVGYPNVGKSNILEALSLYGVLLKGEYFNFNDLCRVKYFTELFYNQNFREPIHVNLDDSIDLELIINDHLNEITFDFKMRSHDGTYDRIFGSEVVPKAYQERLEFRNAHGGYYEENHPFAPIKFYRFSENKPYQTKYSSGLSVPYGNNLLDILQRETELRKEIVSIFNEYKLKPILDRVDQTIKFQKELEDGTAVTIPYHQVADTLRRLIYFKAAIQTNSNATLLFEEPEAHMFPPYISKFTNDIIGDKKGNHFFITTHSPFVLNDLMEEVDGSDLSVYVVGLKDGETIIRKLSDNEVTEIYKFGIDLFFNLEDYLKDAVG